MITLARGATPAGKKSREFDLQVRAMLDKMANSALPGQK
jgi:hypothetical protein